MVITTNERMTKKQVRDNVFRFLRSFDAKNKIKEKFNNICGKTGQYNVPNELFLQRTSRKCRVLISWKTVKKNKISIKQLESFTGGVVVEFVNEDYFNEDNQKDPLFIELKNRLGSDELVSSMISIRTEDKGSSSQKSRESFKKLIKEFPDYKSKIIRRKKEEYRSVNEGNEKWEGFIYVSIRGGQQDVIETHFTENKLDKKRYYLFNPACDFANESTCLDIDLVMSYFAIASIEKNKLNENQKQIYSNLKNYIEFYLEQSEYENEHFTGNLLVYCKNHPCLKMSKDKLFDPLQVKEIFIEDFAIDNKEDERNLDFTHDEAVNKNKYYWDKKQKCLLSPSRPTNIFWSRHLSNMMQQNFSLEEYFEYEEEIVKRRRNLLNQS